MRQNGNQNLVRRMVRIRRRFPSGREATAHSLGRPFRSGKPLRDWRLGTATRRSVHLRQRALCLGGMEPVRTYRQQPCLPSGISGLYDRRTLAQSLDLEVRQQRGRIGSGAIATSRGRWNLSTNLFRFCSTVTRLGRPVAFSVTQSAWRGAE
jgi:hypothetical protein